MKAKTFRKTFPMLPAIALTAATLALTAALPARATTFIKDVMLIGGTLSETTALKAQYQAEGWSVINYDLNHGCSGSTDYIFLLYKAEEDTSGDRDYVTGFYIKSGASNVTTTFTSGGKTYTLTPYYGGSHFNDLRCGDLLLMPPYLPHYFILNACSLFFLINEWNVHHFKHSPCCHKCLSLSVHISLLR